MASITFTFPSKAELAQKISPYKIMDTFAFHFCYRQDPKQGEGIREEVIARVEHVLEAVIRQLANNTVSRQDCHRIIDKVLTHQDSPYFIRGKLIECFESVATMSVSEIVELQSLSND